MKDHFFWFMLRGNHPPNLLTSRVVPPLKEDGRECEKFSSVSRSRRRSRSAYPFRTSTFFRIAVGCCCCTFFVQRGSDCIICFMLFMIQARKRNVNGKRRECGTRYYVRACIWRLRVCGESICSTRKLCNCVSCLILVWLGGIV